MALSALALPGCSGDASELEMAYRHSVDDGHRFLAERDLLHVAQDLDLEGGVEAVAEQIKERLGDCATVTSVQEGRYDLTLGNEAEGEAECELRGRSYRGTVQIWGAATDTGFELTQELDLEDLERGMALVGRVELVSNADGLNWTVSLDASHEDRSGEIEGWRTERPLDPALGFDSGVIVDGERTLAGGERFSMQARQEALAYRGEEVVPRSGEIRHARRGERGEHEIGMTFTELDEGRVEVRFEAERGGGYLIVDPATGDILERELEGRGRGGRRGGPRGR